MEQLLIKTSKLHSTALLASIALLIVIAAACSDSTIDSNSQAISQTNDAINESSDSNSQLDGQFIVGSDLRILFTAVRITSEPILSNIIRSG